MPVRRFHDVSEMEDTLWREPGDPALCAAIRRVWEFAARTCQLRFPPGVHRHRTVDDAQDLREVWAERNFQAFQEARRTKRRSSSP